MNFEVRVSRWQFRAALPISPMRRISPIVGTSAGDRTTGNRAKAHNLPAANHHTQKMQSRSGVLTRAACVSRLAALFAGHPRSGSLCSMGPPHRMDWRRSRPVLMVFQDAVSEKSAVAANLFFFQIRVAPMTGGWRPLGVMLPAELGTRLKHPQSRAAQEIRKIGKPEMCSPRSNNILQTGSL
jgi:hypothetical protein